MSNAGCVLDILNLSWQEGHFFTDTWYAVFQIAASKKLCPIWQMMPGAGGHTLNKLIDVVAAISVSNWFCACVKIRGCLFMALKRINFDHEKKSIFWEIAFVSN